MCHFFKYSESVTIYYYKSNEEEEDGEEYRGTPVVLNFSEYDCFLRCCEKDNRVVLQAEVSPTFTFTLLRFGDTCGPQKERAE